MITPSSPLRGLPLAVVDCESTGLPPDGRVVEVAVVHVDVSPESVPRVVLSERVNPGCPISEGARRTHGITDADVAACPTWLEVLPRVMAACNGRVVTAYNVPADWGFMIASGGSPAPWDAWLDLHVVATSLDKYAHSLGQVAARYGVSLDAHGATGDAVTTALVARPLLRDWWRQVRPGSVYNRMGEIEPDGEEIASAEPTVGGLLSWQRRAAIAQEADFVAFVQRKHGTHGERPDTPWHSLLGLAPPSWPEPPRPTWRVERDGTVVRIEEVPS